MSARAARRVASAVLLACAAGCGTLGADRGAAGVARTERMADRSADEVARTERAFAKTMADRDAVAFARFVAEDAVFISQPRALHGRGEVMAHWARFFTAPAAPFSWEPDQVEVLATGDLAFSSGPVRDAGGKRVGRFNSVWRREGPGVWRIVFDKGSDFCSCDAATK